MKNADDGISDGEGAVGSFFDALSDDYTCVIERCFPRYREMLWAILNYLPQDLPVNSILELGSGTGNLSVLLAETYPQARIRLVDLSSESIEVSRKRLGSDPRFTFEQQDFRELAYPTSSFDLIASSISIHHLTSPEKQTLFQHAYSWLRPSGLLVFADQLAGATSDISARHVQNWKQISQEAGSTDEEWGMWMRHQDEHDHHDSLTAQLTWLDNAGFSVVDCTWRYLLWAVVQARK